MPRASTTVRLRDWLRLACTASVRCRALLTSALIGTLLALINHGSELFSGQMTRGHWLRVAMTYLVPYCVATWSSVQTIRQLQSGNQTTMENS